MKPPPPLPAASAIRHQIFHGQAAGGIRLAGGKVLTERIEDAHQKAEAWLRSRPDTPGVLAVQPRRFLPPPSATSAVRSPIP